MKQIKKIRWQKESETSEYLPNPFFTKVVCNKWYFHSFSYYFNNFMEYHKAIKIRLIEDNEMLYRKYNKRSKSRIKIISIAIPIWFKTW